MDLMQLRRGLLEMITHTSGGDPIPAGCEIGLFTVTENENTHTISHSLGEVPKFAYCFLTLNKAWSNIAGGTILNEELMSDPETGTFDVNLNGNHKRNNVQIMNSDGKQFYGTNTYTTYPASMTSSTVTFATGRYYSGQFKANSTYIYILIK